MRVHQSIYIDRSADEVFAFLADRSNDRMWRVELVSSHTVGDVHEGVGMRVHQTIAYQGHTGEANFEITELEPGRRICLRAHGGIRAHGCLDVQPDGDGTNLTVSATVELKGAASMLERYIRQQVEEAAAVDLVRLKAVLEG